MNTILKQFFLICFYFILSLKIANSDEVRKINVTGNSTVSYETVLALAEIKSEKFDINIEKLNNIQKKLFESSFFSSVDVSLSGQTLNIRLLENPLVDYILISGIDEHPVFKREIEKFLTTKVNSIFSENILNKDISLIKEYLASEGYFKNSVEFTVRKNEKNFVNIFFDINLNNKFLIKNIYFIGNTVFSSSTLSSVISSTEDYWLNIFSSSSIPSLRRLNYDISSIKNFYLTEGYYDVQVSNASIELFDNNHVNLTFSIDSGPKYIINESYADNKSNSLTKENVKIIDNLAKELVKKTYNYKKINDYRDKINNYLDKIAISSDVTYSINKTSNNSISIKFIINELIQKRVIKDILVKGNDITEEKVIRNNLLFVEGDFLNRINVKKSKDLLQSLGLFKSVDVEIVEDNKADLAQIIITVKEEPTGEISSGIGVGSAGSNISFSLKEKNFLGKGIETNTSFEVGTNRVLGVLAFSNPDFADTGNLVKNSLHIVKYNYDKAGYENKLIGDEFSIKYDIFDNISFENGFGVSTDDIRVLSNASNLISSQKGKYLTTKYFYRFFSDERNRKFQPNSGYTIGFGQDLAFAPSDIPFFSNNFYGSVYNEFSTDYVGSIKYKIKTINSLSGDSIKLSDRLFSNDGEMRGFSFRGVGPKVNNDYIGGNYLITTSVGTTVPNGLPEKWNAKTNIFVDLGNIWGSDLSGVSDSNTIRSSVGVGLTWSSPLGPLSFSYAEPITKNSSDGIENFSFRIGGSF